MPTQGTNTRSREQKLGNYISFDGGPKGFSGLSALYILREMLERLEFDYDSGNIRIPEDVKPDEIAHPRSWFGLFVGTGPGAVNAVLLGRLRMSVSQAIEAYAKLIPYLSAEPTNGDEERKRNSAAFAAAFTEVLVDAGFSAETPMLDESAPKTAICTVRTTIATPPYLIRSYRARGSRQPDFTILQAVCASVASLDKFSPFVHGEGHKRLELASAMAGYGNPTQELIREAKQIFGESAQAAAVVSIGTGKIKLVNLRDTISAKTNMDAVKQIVANCELVHRDIQTRLGDTGIYFRFNLDREVEEECDISTMTSAYLEDVETNKRLDKAMSALQQQPNFPAPAKINLVKASTATMKPRPSLVPHFIGRDDILEALCATHFPERSPGPHGPAISVLRGLGGSGKTQLGLKFALEFGAEFAGVPIFFLDASSESNLQADYQFLIRSQEYPCHSPTYNDALAWLATEQKEWLAVLDNADDPTLDLFRYIPKSHNGHVIITTRNDTYAALAPNSSHHIEGLSITDATLLLLKISQYTESDINQTYAEAIVQGVGCLPLAVAHAGAYIGMHRCISTYLETYNKSKAELMLLKPNMLPQDYQMSVATTIQMSLDRVSPRARDAMQVFARLNAMSIAHGIIKNSAERHFCDIDQRPDEEALKQQTIEQANALMATFCPSGEWDEFKFSKVIEECLQYSLLRVTVQEEARFYSMHILVQSYIKTSASTVRDCRPSQLSIRLLGSAITMSNDYTYLAYNRLLVPHVRVIEMTEIIEPGDHECFANVLREQGNALSASCHLKSCITKRKQLLGDDHPDTVRAMSGLALSYHGLGKHQDALELMDAVLKIRLQLLGDDHPDTMRAMNNLALPYRDLGRYQDVLKLMETVLRMRKRLLGDNHPDTVRAMSGLALSYHDLGKHQNALELMEMVLKMRLQLLGDDHPDTVRAMNNVALLYCDLGRHQEAWELREAVLKMWKQLLGDDHPDTVLAMNNLASSYSDLGRHQDALGLRETVLKMRKRLLGDDHPYTIRAMSNLALSYCNMERHQDALELMETVLMMQKHLLGDDHLNTVQAMHNLASLYRDMGRPQDALELMEAVLEMRKNRLGDGHPDTVQAMHNLASSYRDLGRHQDALELMEMVLMMQKWLLGDDHPDNVLAMNNLVSLYYDLGRYGDALELGQRALQVGRHSLGEENPKTLLSMWNLLLTLDLLGMEEERLALLCEASSLYAKVHGEDHSQTIHIREWINEILHDAEFDSS